MRRFVPLPILLFVVACTTTPSDLLKTAQTPAQYAFALYGTFVVTEEAAADIAEDPSTPPVVKAVIKTADAIAKPAADAMLEAARTYVGLAAQLEQGDPDVTIEDVSTALSYLIAATQRARPSIEALITAIKNL